MFCWSVKTGSKRVSVVTPVVGPGCNLYLMGKPRHLQWLGKVGSHCKQNIELCKIFGFRYTKLYFTVCKCKQTNENVR